MGSRSHDFQESSSSTSARPFLNPDGTLTKGAAPSFQAYTEEAFARWAEAQRETVARLMDSAAP